RRLVSDRPENCQSVFVRSAPTTLTNRNGRGSTPLPAWLEVLESKTKTISQTSSGLCPCQPLTFREPLISIPSGRAELNRSDNVQGAEDPGARCGTCFELRSCSISELRLP